MAAVIREAGPTIVIWLITVLYPVPWMFLPHFSYNYLQFPGIFSFFFTANHKTSPTCDFVGIHREADSQSISDVEVSHIRAQQQWLDQPPQLMAAALFNCVCTNVYYTWSRVPSKLCHGTPFPQLLRAITFQSPGSTQVKFQLMCYVAICFRKYM